MRRAAAAVIGTVAGTSLLVVTKLGVHPPDAGLAGNDTSAVAGAGGPSPVLDGDDGQEDGGPAPASTGPAQAQPSAAQSRPAGAPATTAPPRPTQPQPTAGSGLRNGSFTGTGVTERYGTITVTITVSGGRVTDASATCGGCSGESQSISTGAFSRLRQEALQAQSATIATVSGATYTSGAYKTSLQAALNAAHA